MSTQNVTITTQGLPIGFCAVTPDQWSTMVASLTASVSGNFRNFNYGPTEPQIKTDPWFRTFPADGTPDKLYFFINGVWISPHPVAEGVTILYTDSANPINIDQFDGGETGGVTPTSGPMWERLTEFNARVPMGIGPLPGGGSVVINVNGGNEEHTLTIAQLPAHTHTYTKTFAGGDANDGGGNGVHFQDDVTGLTGSGQAFSLLPPYRGTVFLRKSARRYYRL